MKDSISVIICAYNEEKSVAEAIRNASRVVAGETGDWEIIVVNDASSDNTLKEAEKAAKDNNRIRIISHKSNLGFGRAFRTGIENSSKKYLAGYTSDCDLLPDDFKKIISARKRADIISSYLTNMGDRSKDRKYYSEAFIKMMNFMFGLHLKYFNGYFICETGKLKELGLKSEGFTLFAEIKIKLLRKGGTILEVPIVYAPRKFGVSKALSRKSITQAVKILPILIRDVYFA